MSNTFRTTISIPKELKEQMAACNGDVNWSAVACEAFRAKLVDLARCQPCADTLGVTGVGIGPWRPPRSFWDGNFTIEGSHG